MELIRKYFPAISSKQEEQFIALQALYEEWNAQINVISRKDMDSFYVHHVLHSLGIAKVQSFNKGMNVLDIGTGGGFPGIPLAIMFPEAHFHLVDSIGKKIKVVNAVAEELGLKNVQASHARAEDVEGQYNFIVSRAVTQLQKFLPWTKGKIKGPSGRKGSLPNGLLYLKGGDLKEELTGISNTRIYELPDYFEEKFFETKKVVYVMLERK